MMVYQNCKFLTIDFENSNEYIDMPMMMQGVPNQTGYMMNVPVDNFQGQPQQQQAQQMNQYQLPGNEIDQSQQFSIQNLQLQMLQQQYNPMNLQQLGQQQGVNQQVLLGPQQQVIGVGTNGMK